MTEFLIVYGTLRKGLSGYLQYLAFQEPVGLVKVQGFDMYIRSDQGYIFIIKGHGTITGEIYSVNIQKIEELDEYEECPYIYSRIRIQVNDLLA